MDQTQLLSLYERMLYSRFTEDCLDRQYRMGTVRGMGHWGTGLEAISIGASMALENRDILYTTHRGFGEYLGKGMSCYKIFAEHLGKATGCCGGKGTIHLADKSKGLWGMSGALGTDFSLMVGTAMGLQRQGTQNVAMKLFGEGAWQQCELHPSFLLAVQHKAPAIFVLCNNQWIEHHHYRDVIPMEDLYPVAQSYGMKTWLVEDGNDVEAVYTAVCEAVENARAGNGPAFIECKSYRMAGHFAGDPGEYMPKDELEKWRLKDPIEQCRKKLLEAGTLTEEQDTTLRVRLKEEIQAAFNQAFADPEPDPAEIYEGVYAGMEVTEW